MRILIIFLSVVAACGAAFGAYALVQLPTPAAVTVEGELAQGREDAPADLTALEEGMEDLKRDYEEFLETMRQQAIMITEQNKKIAALEKRLSGMSGRIRRGADSDEGDWEELDIASTGREAFKQQVSAALAELRQERQQEQSQQMQKRFAAQIERQVQKVAEKFDWTEQEKQQVIDLLAQGRQQAQQLRRKMGDRELTPEERESLQAEMREANERTQEALKAILTEAEYKELQKQTRQRSGGRRGNRPRWGGSGRQGRQQRPRRDR